MLKGEGRRWQASAEQEQPRGASTRRRAEAAGRLAGRPGEIQLRRGGASGRGSPDARRGGRGGCRRAGRPGASGELRALFPGPGSKKKPPPQKKRPKWLQGSAGKTFCAPTEAAGRRTRARQSPGRGRGVAGRFGKRSRRRREAPRLGLFPSARARAPALPRSPAKRPKEPRSPDAALRLGLLGRPGLSGSAAGKAAAAPALRQEAGGRETRAGACCRCRRRRHFWHPRASRPARRAPLLRGPSRARPPTGCHGSVSTADQDAGSPVQPQRPGRLRTCSARREGHAGAAIAAAAAAVARALLPSHAR